MAIDNKDKKVLKSSIEREQNEVACSAECEKIKGSKNLNVPPLRFPEFTEEWRSHFLTDFMSFKNGMNPDAKRFGRGTKFISVMDILNNQFICYDNIRASVEVMDGDIDTYGVNYGDILFQRSSETLEDVGQANVYLDSKPAIFGGFVIRGKSKGNYNPLFFRYLLASPTARKRIIVKGAGAQHFNIGQDGLSKVSLDIPCMQEQKKIGELLQCIDARIATQNKIIEDLKKLKCAIIEKVLNGNNANNLRLGDVGSYIRGLTYSSDDVVEYNSTLVMRSNNIVNGSLLDYQNNVVSVNKQISQEQQLQDGDIIICMANGSSALVGKSSFYDGKCISPITVGAFCGIYRSKTAITKWLFQTNRYRRYIWNSLQGGNGAIANLNSEDILRMSFPLPDKQTAERCIKLLSSLESLIESNISLCSKFFQQKEYLLRQMFI